MSKFYKDVFLAALAGTSNRYPGPTEAMREAHYIANEVMQDPNIMQKIKEAEGESTVYSAKDFIEDLRFNRFNLRTEIQMVLCKEPK